jgi:outer membrane protein assembly factor BamA
MPRCPKSLLLVPLLICGLALGLRAQSAYVYLDSVEFVGNKKTRAPYMLREMNIRPGDSVLLSELMPALKTNERLLLNTGLFSAATLNVVRWEGRHITVQAKVSEIWYIIPWPSVELADRNFNVWWVEMGRKLNRINGALYLDWANFTGRNDPISFTAQLGYTRKLEFDYRLPLVRPDKPIGFSFNVLYSDNKELAYACQDNKLLFFQDFETSDRQFRRFRVGGSIIYRRGLYGRHELGINYLDLHIGDTVARLNPDYFLDGKTHQQTLNLKYRFAYDRRDVRPYPTKGYYLRGIVEKVGVPPLDGANQLFVSAAAGLYLPLHKRWHVSLWAQGRKALLYGPRQPFYNQVALGYFNDFVRGHQYYVVNGQDYALFQSDVHFKALDVEVKVPKFPLKALRNIPLRLYCRWHGDLGYVWDRYYAEGNPLSNRLLGGTGLSLDLVLMYNAVFQADYTVNFLGEKGLYLRLKGNF